MMAVNELDKIGQNSKFHNRIKNKLVCQVSESFWRTHSYQKPKP